MRSMTLEVADRVSRRDRDRCAIAHGRREGVALDGVGVGGRYVDDLDARALTGGSPPAARMMPLLSVGWDVERDLDDEAVPPVPTRCTRWSSSICVEHVKAAWRPPKSSTADVSTSVPNCAVTP